MNWQTKSDSHIQYSNSYSNNNCSCDSNNSNNNNDNLVAKNIYLASEAE